MTDDLISDGYGNAWRKCGVDCDLQVVRPGKVQCSCDDYSVGSTCFSCGHRLTERGAALWCDRCRQKCVTCCEGAPQ